MKTLLSTILTLLSTICFSQFYTSVSPSFDRDICGYQFSEQIDEIIKLSREKKVKQIKIDLTEYDEPKKTKENTQLSKIIISLENDSFTNVLIETKGGKHKFKYGYRYENFHGIYKLIGTFDTPISKLNNVSETDKHTIIWEKKDTTIITVFKYDTITNWHGKFNKDLYQTKHVDTNITSEFYLNKKNELISYKYNNKTRYSVQSEIGNYFSTDSTKVQFTYRNKTQIFIKKVFSKNLITDRHYIKEETEYFKLTNENPVNTIEKSITKYNYLLNKDYLPSEIKIIKSQSELRTEGSYMKIKYKF